MNLISIASVVQELSRNHEQRHATGEIQNREDVFSETAAAALQNYHNGPFAFLAFDPRIDTPVTEYVETGALTADTGTRVLLLMFAMEQSSPLSQPSATELGLPIDIRTGEHPSVTVINKLFPTLKRPILPGILFFDELLEPVEAVYVSLAGYLTVSAVANVCRTVFAAINLASHNSNTQYDDFCAVLLRERIVYSRSQPACFREWLYRVRELAREFRGEVFALFKMAL